ncbi:MAG: PQQ-dependent sugar dehydrogenase [Actinomycetota bacterium]|nr:PQQ-dependent sugar dehydrogenase [Actinomycetota bacterium]
MKRAFVMIVGVIALVARLVAAASAQSTPPCTPSATVRVIAEKNAFDRACLAAPEDAAFKIRLENRDPFSHNLSIYRQKGGDALFQGAYVTKASSQTYSVPPQKKGSYYFQCDIHPFMNGTFLVGAQPVPSQTAAEVTRASAGARIKLVKVADGFTAPVFSTGAGDGSGRLFVVDQIGLIRVVDAHGSLLAEPFLDLRDKIVKQNPNYDERGLLGLAFHPRYKDNGRFFVWYSAPLRAGAPKGWDNTIHLSEFSRSASDPNRADPRSEKIVMQIDHPQANHNSGHISFGPDGLLYAPIGDGGNANDVGLGHPPKGNGQDLTTILGNILRIDVDNTGGKPYAIPKDNPYAHDTQGRRPEIFANGFRNPYHLSFDAGGEHTLYVADAGQDRFEEVDAVTAGGNYGWHIKEGTHCFSANSPARAPDSCPAQSEDGKRLIDPVIEYDHTKILGSVIIGGYISRGVGLPALKGMYVFGDYSRDRVRPDGTMFVAEPKPDGLWAVKELQVQIDDDPDPGPGFGRFVISFGQGDDRELYVGLTGRGGPEGQSGAVYRLAAIGGTQASSHQSSDRGRVWAWILFAVAILLVLIGAGVLLSRRRGTTTGN